MQSLRSLLAPAVLTALAYSPAAIAQEPEATPPAASESAPATEAPAAQPEAERTGRRRRGRRRALTVIEAGTVHPVSGPPIKNGVVVIRGDRILAIGKQGDLRLPPNTAVHTFPNGHVYPGLIDAATDAFTDRGLQNDGALNGGSKLADGLIWLGERDDQLAAAGITTAYVTVRNNTQLSGQGALVRPRKDGFELWKDREQAALQLRMTAGPTASHPLQRQQQLEGVGRMFDGLDKYREAQEKFEEDLEKYNEEFEKYLEHHQKKNGKGGDKKDAKKEGGDAKKPAETKPETAGPSGPRRRRGPRPGGGKAPAFTAETAENGDLKVSDEDFERAMETLIAVLAEEQRTATPAPAAPQGPQGKPASTKQGPAKDGAKKGGDSKDKGPARPKYPKKPRVDEQKDALLKVLDGDLPLRVRAHRMDELRAVLRMQRDKEIPLLVLEEAFAADRVADEIAKQGATVVLTNLLPNSLKTSSRKTAYDSFDPVALPAKLNAAGVPFAIATGKARLAPLLPLMAAGAVGRGLSEEAALRAITLTPAEILGIQKDTGSLARGKYADVLVTDGPLFATDSHVLMVLSRGRTEFEAK